MVKANEVNEVKKEETKAISTNDTQEAEAPAKTPAQKTLSELVSGIVQSCINDPRVLPQCYRDLEMWYNAQPLEGRRELITKVKKQIETAKLTTEALYGQFQMISQRDL